MKTLSKAAQKELFRADGELKSMYAQTITESVSHKIARPVTYSGSGRNIKVRDMSNYIIYALNAGGYKFTTGNDSPRGGQSGNYIKFSAKATEFLNGLLKGNK